MCGSLVGTDSTGPRNLPGELECAKKARGKHVQNLTRNAWVARPPAGWADQRVAVAGVEDFPPGMLREFREQLHTHIYHPALKKQALLLTSFYSGDT